MQYSDVINIHEADLGFLTVYYIVSAQFEHCCECCIILSTTSRIITVIL